MLRLKLDSSLATIVSCGVLHNIARKRGLPDIEDDANIANDDVPVGLPRYHNQGGNAYRAVYVQLFNA